MLAVKLTRMCSLLKINVFWMHIFQGREAFTNWKAGTAQPAYLHTSQVWMYGEGMGAA